MALQQVSFFFFLTWQETCSCALCTACVRWSGSAFPLLSEGSSPWGPERFFLWKAGGHFVAHWNRGQQNDIRKQLQLDYKMGTRCRDKTHTSGGSCSLQSCMECSLQLQRKPPLWSSSTVDLQKKAKRCQTTVMLYINVFQSDGPLQERLNILCQISISLH